MKTPDEIKKGLECCTAEINECDSCPYREYNWCEEKLKVDALELLGDLFKDREERDDLAEECQNLEQRLAQVERERDAAVKDLDTALNDVDVMNLDCNFCKHKYRPVCKNCEWEWRGACEENSKESSHDI